jgi:hypothetical protein
MMLDICIFPMRANTNDLAGRPMPERKRANRGNLAESILLF